MNSKFFFDSIIKSFDFDPTEDQKNSIIKISEFLLNKNSKKIFLLRGYAGSGKTSGTKTGQNSFMVGTSPAFYAKATT